MFKNLKKSGLKLVGEYFLGQDAAEFALDGLDFDANPYDLWLVQVLLTATDDAGGIVAHFRFNDSDDYVGADESGGNLPFVVSTPGAYFGHIQKPADGAYGYRLDGFLVNYPGWRWCAGSFTGLSNLTKVGIRLDATFSGIGSIKAGSGIRIFSP